MSNPIGKYIELQGGFAFKSSDFQESGIPLIRISNITTNGLKISGAIRLPLIYQNELRCFLASENDSIIAMSGATTGKCCIIKKSDLPCLINQRVGRFKILNEKEVDKRFVFYVITSEKFQNELFKDAIGGAQPNISPKQIERIRWEFPNYKSQKYISNILLSIDIIIEKTKFSIDKYKAIKQGMLHDLFTRGIDISTGKLRPRYEDAPELYKESKLGWVPKEWKVEKLDTICFMKSGEGITSQRIFELSDFPVYGGNGLRGFTNSFTHNGEYTLIGRQGALCGNITRVNGKFYASEHAVVVTVIDEINVDWLSQKLNTMKLNQYSEASAQPGLSVNKILKLIVSTPPFNEQKTIAERLLSIDNKLQTEKNYLQKMQQLKKGLMNDLLSGRKEVTLKDEKEVLIG